ncbi:MAG: glycosyltransferase family 9 protein [Alphaproteobacteria bacterium]|nr:glycosyltransferase family 9 protein [Alphaproteobacteria bacterium]
MSSRILVIKLGALGDIVQALGPFAAIRRHHADAEITLLTTLPFAEFLKRSPYFDQVWVDPRASWRRVDAVLALRRRLADGGFERVYDLQTSRRSGRYFLFWPQPRPEWSGIAGGCSHPDPDPNRDHIHTLDRQAGQLRGAGIAAVPPPDLSWVVADVARFELPRRYALLAPGAAAHRPEKRWPEASFAALARDLLARGVTPALLGTAEERPILRTIAAAAPGTRDLAGETNLEELVGLGRDAALSVGNDTGPMHLLTVAGSPAIVLFSHASDPALCAPRGPGVEILRAPSLAELPVESVLARVPGLLREPADAAHS